MITFWKFFYTRLSSIKNPVFRHRELEVFEPAQWEPLLKERILVRASVPETFIDPKGNTYTVRESGDRIFCVDDSGELPAILQLTSEDILEYKISSNRLLNAIQKQNDLRGSGQNPFDDLLFLGNYQGQDSIDCAVYLSLGNARDKSLDGRLLKLSKPSSVSIIITPEQLNIDPNGTLERAGIFLGSLEPNLQISWPRNIHLPLIEESRLASVIGKGFKEVGVNIAGLESENEMLKQSLADQMSNISGEVEPEYFTWILHILAVGSVSGAAKSIGMAKSTFDEKVKAYRARGGVYETLFQLFQVRRNSMGTRKLERFNELYAEHQTEPTTGSDLNLLKDIFDAFSEQAPDNWDGIRDEMLDLLQDYVPEK